MPTWFGRTGITRTLIISTRVTVVAVVSLLLARSWLGLPEFYWAPISGIVVILSTIPPRTLAWQRFVGTGIGAVLGALIATFLQPNWIVYGIGVLLSGLVCSLLRISTAYRFAAITLSIVLLITHSNRPWIVALHRFEEVSLGIAVALLITVVWPAPSCMNL
jgi:uncharacterized membrane protein YgaE (UPF0421/DUF939 family)